MPTALIVLAAGQGTRMLSDRPKVLHEVGNLPLFAHALIAGRALDPDRAVLVIGHGGDAVRQAAQEFDPEVEIVEQDRQLGTGHAVAVARPALKGFEGDIVVLYADTPFITADTLDHIARARRDHDIVVLGFHAADPGRYGRLITHHDQLLEIVEFNDASAVQRDITFCNSGIISADAKVLFRLIDGLDNRNARGEIYLTDIVAKAVGQGLTATAIECAEEETLGVNSRADLAAAEAIFQARARAEAMENGVTLVAPETVFFSADTVIGRDTRIEPNVVFGPGVTVETGALIRSFSHLEGAHVGGGAVVGPYARLRPGAELSNDVHIGNFVEIKNASIGEATKVNHLSYIGDATIGGGTNIGAGTITCNYDGVMKHRTEIGDGVFIGSDTMLVAPVRVGHGAMTATGTVVSKDVPDGALAIGRADQQNKPGLAAKLFEKFKAAKAKRQKGQ